MEAATDFRIFWDNAYAEHHLVDQLRCLGRGVGENEIEVAGGSFGWGQGSSAVQDPMRIEDDFTLFRLSEDLREANRRDHATGQEIRQYVSGAHRGELVSVTQGVPAEGKVAPGSLAAEPPYPPGTFHGRGGGGRGGPKGVKI